MFWSSVKKYQDAIEASIAPLTRAFMVQMDEIRRTHRVPDAQWDEMEVFAFVMWVYHMGIMNADKSTGDMQRLQETLNDAANGFIFHYLGRHPSFAPLPLEQRKSIHGMIIDNVLRRAFEYNDAFNRDKIHANNPGDADPCRYQIAQLLGHAVQNADARQRMTASNDTIFLLISQLFQQVFGLFGKNFMQAA